MSPRPRARPRRARAGAAPRVARGRSRPIAPRAERWWVAALVAAHLAFAIWGAARQSVTFDENFHLPAGVMVAARGELRISAVNPPLVKGLAGAAALAAGARLPADSALANGEQGVVGLSFMRANADRYQRVFFAGRLVVIALSGLLALLVWRLARALHGPAGGLLALGFYAFSSEALAHAGVVTMDLATGLGWLATVAAFRAFALTGRWRWWWATAGALGATFLVRLTAVFLPVALVLLAAWALATRRARRPARLVAGVPLLALSTLAALQVGYLGRTSLDPLSRWHFESATFQRIQHAWPWLRPPVPDSWLGGFDRQAVESQPGQTKCYALGAIRREAPVWYFPLAMAVKYPLGFLAALLALAIALARRATRAAAGRGWVWLALPAGLYLAIAMFVGRLGIGVRYVFAVLPFLCVALGALASARLPRAAALVPRAGWAFALAQAIEVAAHAPWHLSFFNSLSGGPAHGMWIVNDSNVDWGQGLIALREELARRGIGRVHLAYHGTADPSVYGIDYVPYLGGAPGPESDWLAVSSYYFVGLSQRMTTRAGRTPDAIRIDFRPLWPQQPVARPAGCMLLFRVR